MTVNKKKLSLFNTIIALALLVLVLAFYINNIIGVNQLTVKVNTVKDEIGNTEKNNEMLRTEIEKLSSFDVIKQKAAERLNIYFNEKAIEKKKQVIINKSDFEKKK
ncbi:MAG: hypothetical protein FJ216_02645 [Ignavibacteria bacterium]|nr:hypothetical protein [Ignavibacteria bacterium]